MADNETCETLGDLTLDKLAREIADAIRIGDTRKEHVANLLIAFAEEIKRQAIEP